MTDKNEMPDEIWAWNTQHGMRCYKAEQGGDTRYIRAGTRRGWVMEKRLVIVAKDTDIQEAGNFIICTAPGKRPMFFPKGSIVLSENSISDWGAKIESVWFDEMRTDK